MVPAEAATNADVLMMEREKNGESIAQTTKTKKQDRREETKNRRRREGTGQLEANRRLRGLSHCYY